MAAGVIRNFLVPTPSYFYQHPQSEEDRDEEEKLQERPEEREDEEEEMEEGEEEEEEEDEGSDAQEEEGESLEAHYAVDVTKQLLTFADLISRDVQRYFGRRAGNQEACDIYSDSVSVTTGGRLRYYDDLLRIARAGSPEEKESGSFLTCSGLEGAGGAGGPCSSLGPLAELFHHVGPAQGRGQPMIKRHLPLSFWTEPIRGFADAPGVTRTSGDPTPAGGTHTDTDAHMSFNEHHNAHALDNNQLDFSDLLAYWDPNPELTHTMTENTHMEH